MKPDYLLHAQGGFLMDKSFDKTYKGFNLLNVGVSRLKNNKLQSLQLEMIRFKVEDITFLSGFSYPVRGYTGEHKSTELIYNHSLGLTRDIKNGFYVGPSVSIIFNSNLILPATTASFPVEEVCFCIGGGVHAGYNWSLSKSIMLSVSTRITLIDIGWLRTEVRDPNRTLKQQRSSKAHTDFLRPQYPLMIGLNFIL